MSEEPLFKNAFGKWFDDHYAAAIKAMEEQAADDAGRLAPPAYRAQKGLGPDPFGVAWTRKQEPNPLDAALITSPELLVTKRSAIIEVPDELLMDYGLIPDTRPPRPPTPWRWRLRNRIADWRERAARLAYRAIAGQWPDDGEVDD